MTNMHPYSLLWVRYGCFEWVLATTFGSSMLAHEIKPLLESDMKTLHEIALLASNVERKSMKTVNYLLFVTSRRSTQKTIQTHIRAPL